MDNTVSTRPAGSADAGYDKYMLYDVAGIREQVQRMIDGHCTLSASVEAGSTSVVTLPLAVQGDDMWVDVPREHAVLERFLASERVSFQGHIERVSVRFFTATPVLDSHASQPALRVSLPKRLLYLQRRELMRHEAPAGTLNCLVPALGPKAGARPDTPPGLEQATRATTIKDIGGGGLAVLASDELQLSPGDLLPGCIIELPGMGTVEVTLCVRHIRETTQHGKQVRHAGCEFVGLPGATQTKLFRYLMQLERERVSRQRGNDL